MSYFLIKTLEKKFLCIFISYAEIETQEKKLKELIFRHFYHFFYLNFATYNFRYYFIVENFEREFQHSLRQYKEQIFTYPSL